VAEVKLCGMTRREDARAAAASGAGFVGVIFAGGPRTMTADGARDVLLDVPSSVRRVGVFGAASPSEIAAVADVVGLDIIQLHADPDADMVRAVRSAVARPVWAALRVRGALLPGGADSLFADADAVVLDAPADHALGGTGVTLPWEALVTQLTPFRDRARLVLAGGLTPANVADAISALGPDIVAVSSGVESAPGIKDHQMMRAFIGAARSKPRAA
jgi:phosphoribosylanthranilate isomerase